LHKVSAKRLEKCTIVLKVSAILKQAASLVHNKFNIKTWITY